ncbi:hypothetical protein Patl1_13627 [Pistacia atlantica]|uniref:Uncharacterized protein n=1 Tax=Pistacia atlantica TaxID=434234 RepID=A0ACC1AXP0_9ROSI|nr:hypothetical protein Patl1_13627 [Pistacia atlantica]
MLASLLYVIFKQNEKYWPLMPPLPSYGYGREHPGPRYGSLIHGQNLKDVVITASLGVIPEIIIKINDLIGTRNVYRQSGWSYQGNWMEYEIPGSCSTLSHDLGCHWTCYFLVVIMEPSMDKDKHGGRNIAKSFSITRGAHLFRLMWSSDILISNITLRDSPFWTLHPYDCKNVTVRNVTILAPVFEAPNTDGIDPDSCEDMVIEDCYISVGDDAIAIKSGWDQYGIAYGRPSMNILIRNLVVRSMVSAGVSIGSEMSGGVSNVTVENLLVWSSRRAVRIKTAPGRGGYVQQITYRNLTFDNVRVGIIIKTDYNEHPDEGYDPKALPILRDISFTGVHGQGVRVPVRIHGSDVIPVRNITFRDMSVGITYKKKHIFQCAFVQGRVIGTIFPAPCENLDLYDEQERLVKRSASQNVTDIDYDF